MSLRDVGTVVAGGRSARGDTIALDTGPACEGGASHRLFIRIPRRPMG